MATFFLYSAQNYKRAMYLSIMMDLINDTDLDNEAAHENARN